LLAGGTALLFGCTTSAPPDPAAKRREIDTTVDTALSQLQSAGAGVRELVTRARGVLVFPRVVSAGFIVGGSYGQGALRKAGATSGYYSLKEGSVGLLAGAESKAMYILFMTQEALQKFTGDPANFRTTLKQLAASVSRSAETVAL
jgi:lipid-binding SYLF domain-containing protein